MSLGIDLVPYKTCSYDCVYCECGKTTNLTTERQEYVPTEEIIAELQEFLEHKPELDYITFSGSGEPTLHTGIGRIVEYLKSNFSKYKIALLTNGSLLFDRDLQNSIRAVDLIMPSFDAYSNKVIQSINRPAQKFDRDRYIAGFKEFFKKYQGRVEVEVFIAKGVNDDAEEIRKIDNFLSDIDVDMIQLNTLDRPGTDEWVQAVSKEELKTVKGYFKNNPAEIIAKFKSRKKSKAYSSDIKAKILETISRRPCTAQDMVDVLGLHLNEVNKYLDVLAREGKISTKKQDRGIFYSKKS